jgi:hypothetical protein
MNLNNSILEATGAELDGKSQMSFRGLRIFPFTATSIVNHELTLLPVRYFSVSNDS